MCHARDLPAFPTAGFGVVFPYFGINVWPMLINIMFDVFMAMYIAVIYTYLLLYADFSIKFVAILDSLP
jgi:hypothetical protein